MIEQFSVYEDRGRALDIGLAAVIDIPVDQKPYGRIFQILIKLFHIQAKLSGDPLYFGIVKFPLVGIQFFMHLPELPLSPCSECCSGRFSCKSMHWEWEVFHNKFHIFRIFLQHLLEEGFKPRTVGSLIVSKNGNCNGGVSRSFKRQPRHINLMNDFNKNDLKGFFCTARYGEHIGSW